MSRRRGGFLSRSGLGVALAFGLLLASLALLAPASLARPAAGGPTAGVGVSPPSLVAAPETDFTVTVNVTEVVDLGSFQFTLGFDPRLVAFREFLPGPFLSLGGRRILPMPIVTGTGQVTFGAASWPGAPGTSGTGELASVRLSALRRGTSPLDLTRSILSGSRNTEITVTVATSGRVLVVGPGGPPDSTIAYLPRVDRQ